MPAAAQQVGWLVTVQNHLAHERRDVLDHLELWVELPAQSFKRNQRALNSRVRSVKRNRVPRMMAITSLSSYGQMDILQAEVFVVEDEIGNVGRQAVFADGSVAGPSRSGHRECCVSSRRASARRANRQSVAPIMGQPADHAEIDKGNPAVRK